MTYAAPPPTVLPQPVDERWRPVRIGLVDLFYYDIEEFHFHRGCLLLRGNNGTGKSKVLALTLPFLLDGELAAHRVEPDGDKHKRMEWNLLLGGKHPHPERLGYTWMEFGRRDSDGTTHFVTIGCGLKAVAGKGIARHWYFVTDQRIGPELSLLSSTRTALTRDRLKDAIGTRGMIYDRATDYRRAVDEALFGLGARYDALMSLLIQLRQPQLSKRPDERLLSNALTQALAPLDENLITQVAEAFRSLDDERTTLRGLQEAKKAADDFLGVYRRYARVAAKRKAAGPRQAHSRYEQLGRDLGEQERAFVTAQAALQAAQLRIAQLEEEANILAARQEALRDSPEMRAAEDLERADDLARKLQAIAVKQQQLLNEAMRAEQRLAVKAEQAEQEHTAAIADQAGQHTAVLDTARAARIADDHTDRIETALAAEQPPYRDARQRAEALATWRTQSVANLRELLRAAGQAEGEAHRTRAEVERLAGAITEAAAGVVTAEERVDGEAAALGAATSRHLAAAVELRLPDVEAVVSALQAWAVTLDGHNPATAAISAAMSEATTALARLDAHLGTVQREACERRERLDEELRRLEDGGHDAPRTPYTRSADARHGAGAPLWKVIDFAPEVSGEDRAGLEAALEAAGLLDAWLLPDGTVLDAQTDDVVLTAGAPVQMNLSRVLRPAVDADDPQASAVAVQTVTAVLARVGHGAASGATTWVDTDGRFSNGALSGRWRKQTASHIGEGARETARRVRVAQLRAELEQLDAQLAETGRQIETVADRRTVLTLEHGTCPGDAELRDAHSVLRTAHAVARRLAEDHHAAQLLADTAYRHAITAGERAAEFANDVALPTLSGELDTVAEAVGGYRAALAAWWPACAAVVAAQRRAGDSRVEHEEAAAGIEPARADHTDADRAAKAARERHRFLQEVSGASVADLQQQLGRLTGDLARVDRDSKTARRQENEATGARGEAQGRRQSLTDELAKAAGERDSQVESLRQFATSGLLTLACPDLDIPDAAQPWPATPAVLLARSIDRALTDVDDADRRWELVQQHVSTDSKTLTDSLSRHSHTATLSVRDDIMIVEVTFQGRTRPIAGLAEALTSEVDERQRILSAHEREVLENHLVNEVAGTLQELISAAEQQVATMNGELEQRPTSTGMRLRLVWRTGKDAPAGLSDLRDRQLRQSTDVWNDDDRRKVGAFLQQQINNERLRDDAGTWIEQLTRALDYRAWHDFAIQRHQDGQWRPATGPASGGERVLAASIPLFAAAASYYSSAHPHAPRLIALDEAFAGVDDDSRAKCLGLLATFDLDVVMTSEREWGCYPQVPGLAIAQLSRHEGIDAVLVTPWRWDGHGHRYQTDRPVPFIPSQPPAPEDAFAPNTLL